VRRTQERQQCVADVFPGLPGELAIVVVAGCAPRLLLSRDARYAGRALLPLQNYNTFKKNGSEGMRQPSRRCFVAGRCAAATVNGKRC
jgi:hypothetical protein